MHISFAPPDISDAEINEVAQALRSGWITTGPRTKQLELAIAKWLGTERCVCLNSQTACGEMVLRLLDIGVGDEVIVPAYTYTATASVVAHVGATLVMIDSQKDRIEMDYDALERAITERTKAVIPVDLAGVPCDYPRILEIVEQKKNLFRPANRLQAAIGRVAVCADAAHAFGAMLNGKMVGSIADFTSFSFHAVKNFTTAEGGALTWRQFPNIDSNALYHQLQLFSLHGQSKDALSKFTSAHWEYDVLGTWYKCNMTDIVAAIGLRQFDRYPDMLRRRKEIIDRYDAVLKPLGVQTLEHYSDGRISSGHLYITRIPNISTQQRDVIFTAMQDRGISCNVHYKPLPMLTAYKNLGFDIADYPNAYDFFANEITLPLYSTLTDEMVEYILANYIEIIKKYI